MTEPPVANRGRAGGPHLFRRRSLWLPTWQGWLLVAGLLAGAVLLASWRVVGFLAVQEVAQGRAGTGARNLVIEGWLDRTDLDQAVALMRAGRYDRVLTTGGPLLPSFDDPARWPSFADRAADYLRPRAPAGTSVVAVAAPASAQDRTFLSAVMVRDWAQREGVALEAIDLVSAGVHARRSRLLFRAALGPGVEVGVIATPPIEYDRTRWWSSSTGTKTVLGETLALAWTLCCFRPPAPGSHAERWGEPAASK